MKNWAIIYPQRNKKCCTDFLETFRTVCPRVSFQVSTPQQLVIQNDNTEEYISQLRSILSKNKLDMVVIVFPALRQDKYTAVKKYACLN